MELRKRLFACDHVARTKAQARNERDALEMKKILIMVRGQIWCEYKSIVSNSRIGNKLIGTELNCLFGAELQVGCPSTYAEFAGSIVQIA
jgi:hypothetical protein